MPTSISTFFAAIRAADLTAVRALATANPSLLTSHDPTCFGAVPLTAAVNINNRAMVDLLLDLGANPNQPSDWWAGGFVPLDSASEPMARHLIARGAKLTSHAAARLGWFDQLRELLTANAALARALGGDGQTPLHYASTPAIADLLLAHGADINQRDIDHASTPAEYLATSHPHTAAHLFSLGATPDPFMAACIGDAQRLERLLTTQPEGVNVRISRQRFPAAPPAAGHIYLYTIGEGCTLLHAAASRGHAGVIRWLASHGADLNARGGYDDATPLHSAAWTDQPAAVAALLDAGADINVKSGPMHRNQPLGWAIVAGSLAAAHVLIERGAAIAPHHRQDAAKGAAGDFREFNPTRPPDHRLQIARLPGLA